MSITRDEWLKALNEAGLERDHDPDAVTASEFAAMFHISRTTARDRLASLVRSGKARVTSKRSRDARGRVVSFTAYRLTT